MNDTAYLPHSISEAFVLQEDHKDLSSVLGICTGDAKDKQKIIITKWQL